MIITISGEAGSGKSTLAKKLAESLDLPRIYVGGIRRDMAKEMGMTLAEFNTWSETNPDGDEPIDLRVQDEARETQSCIVEGRVMYHFLPESFKIFVDVSIDEVARRVWKDLQDDKRDEASDLNSVEDVVASLQSRKSSDDARYQKYYDIDVFNHENYDLVIDSTNMTPDEMFDQAMQGVEDFKNKNS